MKKLLICVLLGINLISVGFIWRTNSLLDAHKNIIVRHDNVEQKKDRGQKTTYDRAKIGREGRAFTGRVIAMTQIEKAGSAEEENLAGGVAVGGSAKQVATKNTVYEFLIETGDSRNVISIVQTNELGINPADRVILIEIDGKVKIRAKYQN